MTPQERLAQQVAYLRAALTRLEEVLDRPEDAVVRDALIKRFEFTFEMAWKCMYRWLRVREVQIPQAAFEVIPRAFRAGLLDDEGAWTEIRLARNRTSHEYDEAEAIRVAAIARAVAAPRFRALAERLSSELHRP